MRVRNYWAHSWCFVDLSFPRKVKVRREHQTSQILSEVKRPLTLAFTIFLLSFCVLRMLRKRELLCFHCTLTKGFWTESRNVFIFDTVRCLTFLSSAFFLTIFTIMMLSKIALLYVLRLVTWNCRLRHHWLTCPPVTLMNRHRLVAIVQRHLLWITSFKRCSYYSDLIGIRMVASLTLVYLDGHS